MAAVWAAGPEPMMTTLLCILRPPILWVSLWHGAPLWERVAAAATEMPVVLERRVWRKYEENSLTAIDGGGPRVGFFSGEGRLNGSGTLGLFDLVLSHRPPKFVAPGSKLGHLDLLTNRQCVPSRERGVRLQKNYWAVLFCLEGQCGQGRSRRGLPQFLDAG